MSDTETEAKVYAGGRLAMKELLAELEKLGHEIRIIEKRCVHSDLYQWPDIIFTQHTNYKYVRHAGKPVVFYAHNRRQERYLLGDKVAFTLYNSQTTRMKNKPTGDYMVIVPQQNLQALKCEPDGDAILIINPSVEKGGMTFYNIARKMPNRKFLAKVGRSPYYKPIAKLPNVEIISDYTPDIRDVYRRARIVLFPSRWHEGWGRVPIEAGISGIPVIATNRNYEPAVSECLGDAGIYCSANRIMDWVEAIESLDNPDYYAERSEIIRKHAQRVSDRADAQIPALEQKLLAIANVKKPAERFDIDTSQRVVIMAAGTGSRWNNYKGVPKQLADVNGEPVIKRTIRLLKERGLTDITVTVRRYGQYGDLGVNEYIKPLNDYAIDRIYGAKDLAPCTFLYGDAYYTERALDIILSDTNEYRFFGSDKPNGIISRREMYGVKANDWLMEKAGELRQMQIDGKIKRSVCQDLNYYISGLPVVNHRFVQILKNDRWRTENYTPINDMTTDLDKPLDYIRLTAMLQRGEK